MWSLLHVVAFDGRTTDFQARKREGGSGRGEMDTLHACMYAYGLRRSDHAGWPLDCADMIDYGKRSVRFCTGVCTDEKIPGR